MKKTLLICVCLLLMTAACYGIVTVTLDGSASTDADGYIQKWHWYQWDEERQALLHLGYVRWDPNEPTDYYVYNDGIGFVDQRAKATFDVELSIGIHHFALAVEDNDGAKSVITMANRLSSSQTDEWVKITVLPGNRPPIIMAHGWEDLLFPKEKISLTSGIDVKDVVIKS